MHINHRFGVAGRGMCRFFRQDVASLTKREAPRRYMTGGGCSCRAGRAGRPATAGREREAGGGSWAEQGAGWISGGSWDRGGLGRKGAGTEGGRWGGRGALGRKGGAGAEGRGRRERGASVMDARTKVSGQKARWRLAGGRWAHEGAGCKCGPDNADKTQSIYRAIKKPPLLGTGAWGITCPEAGERFIRSDDDQKK